MAEATDSEGAPGIVGAGELRSGTTARTALIQGTTFGVKAVQYSVVDGMALFEGDILLGTEQEAEQRTQQLRDIARGAVAQGVAITGAQFRWPSCTIPYTIDAALPNQNRVTDAINHWQTNTRHRFVLRTTQADYVTFRPSSGCSSSVGRQGGQQFVNLGPSCTTGNAIHEIGHVVGLWHEQSREDRDSFVAIHWEKIQAGTEHNFDQHITDGDDIGAYDYGSIMHYPRDAFSRDGSDTITPLTAGASIGQRTALSPGDIAAANSLCPGVVTIKEAPKDGRLDTVKETVKDVRLDTRKEQVLDTVKEAVKDARLDTVKEPTRDPKGPLSDRGPGGGLGPVVNPAVGGGALPFAMAAPQQAPVTMGSGGANDAILDLDTQLQGLADAIAQSEANTQSLQAAYNETLALLKQQLDAADSSPSNG